MSETLIEKFYESFQKKNYESMAECYHENVEFKDPIFQLNGWKAKAMWKMLIERGADLEVSYSDIEEKDGKGKAHWEAVYTFSKTNRKIHNKIDARFHFSDGKIIRHTDSFSLWKWMHMALGIKGLLLGWLPSIQSKVIAEANAGLDLYIKRKKLNPE